MSSKAYWGGDRPTQRGLHRKHLTDACHAALQRLQVDYLDLFFCHRPDLETPIEETVRTMHDLVAQGKVLYWGTSEWSAQQIQEAYGLARQHGLTPPTMEQPQYNMLHRDKVEREFLPLYANLGHAIVTAARDLFAHGIRLQGQGVRLLGFGVSGLQAQGAGQRELFPDPAQQRAHRLAEAADEVRRRFGKDAVTRARLLRRGTDQPVDDDEASSLPSVD